MRQKIERHSGFLTHEKGKLIDGLFDHHVRGMVSPYTERGNVAQDLGQVLHCSTLLEETPRVL
jgi:hypothetical protein